MPHHQKHIYPLMSSFLRIRLMEFSKETRNKIVNGFIDIFTRLSSKEFQKRIWIRGEGPEVDSFEDVVCDFFTECDSILENYEEFGLSETQYDLLRRFRDTFQAFTDENDWPESFIDSPEWNKITEMAKGMLIAFNYKKSRS